MPVSQRAKQFAPFAAVQGLDTALETKQRELERCAPRELSEEAAAAINEQLLLLRPGLRATALYRDGDRYRSIDATFSRLDPDRRLLILGGVRIPLDSLAGLQILDCPELFAF